MAGVDQRIGHRLHGMRQAVGRRPREGIAVRQSAIPVAPASTLRSFGPER